VAQTCEYRGLDFLGFFDLVIRTSRCMKPKTEGVGSAQDNVAFTFSAPYATFFLPTRIEVFTPIRDSIAMSMSMLNASILPRVRSLMRGWETPSCAAASFCVSFDR